MLTLVVSGMSVDDVKENHRLSQLVRKMQDAISTLRDEISDANSELAASRKLFDEQKQILLQELDRERSRRHRAEAALEKVSHRETTSRGTSTEAPPPSEPLEIKHLETPRKTEFDAFCDWLNFTARVREVDFQELFRSLGLDTVERVCANISEGDLLSSGVPPHKAKAVMQCVMECTIQYLQ